MNTKKRNLEKINKRLDMITESLPPPVTFTESEVLEILFEIEGIDFTKSNPNPTQEEINEIYADKEIHTTKFKITEAFQNALRKKGRVINKVDKTPPGAYN
jgi:hypothetical protein